MLSSHRCVLTLSKLFAWKPQEFVRSGNMPYPARKMPILSPMMRMPPRMLTASSCSPWSSR